MRAIRRDVYRVLECLRRLPKGKAAYYRIRDHNPEVLSEPELAARFLYINRYCFNGLYRTNLAGKFNVPYGPPRNLSRSGVDEPLVVSASSMLQRATLINCDFEETLCQAEPGDWVYLDPPYVTAQTRIFSEYIPNSFSNKDLRRLKNALKRLDESGVTFLISYGDTPEGKDLLSDWNPIKTPTRRNIAGFAGHRKTAYEWVATNSREAIKDGD